MSIDGPNDEEDVSKVIFSTVNRMDPFLNIRANLRVIKETFARTDSGSLIAVAVNNKYKYSFIFNVSMMRKFSSSNALTLTMSGSLKKLKLSEAKYGAISE